MPVTSIRLAAGLTEEHQLALLKSITNPFALTSEERRYLMDGIDLLRTCQVVVDDRNLTFAKFFELFIDGVYTEKFIDAVLISRQIYIEGQKQKKIVIAEIRARFADEQWFRQDLLDSRFLIAFCLYWWNSLATGYIFEIEVFRDLQSSGIIFQAHDLRKRAERFSFADLTISNWQGDVKSSTYFFYVARSSGLLHDFYVTRYYDAVERLYSWFVILRLEYWNQIDGETQSMIFPNWPDDFLQPVSFDFGDNKWVAVTYEVWKSKVLAFQEEGV
ncbi:hypothetical protein L0337_11240 [candidate division KSB1 bacterium]|nr:hypothetical protein [candidate division KSB1 bacterium]